MDANDRVQVNEWNTLKFHDPLVILERLRGVEPIVATSDLPDAVSPHALRHTFATRLLARTGDLALVQRALTHSSITSTTNYLRCDDARLREAIGA